MNKLSSKIYKRISFKPGKFKEIADELTNPYRGWYQIHTFKLDEHLTMEDREYTLNATDSLAFVLIDISAYRDKALDVIALENLEKIFKFFTDYRLDMIVRVVYDTEGKCMETEPDTEEQILEHMQQLVPVMKKFTPSIFVYQGLLIGNWGEMHSSKFLSPARLKKLADGFVNQLDNMAYVAVRRPAYVRILFPEGEDIRQTKIGIFDDAILASPTHLGTFGEKPAKEVRREQSWLPEEELAYVSALCDRVPYGGEALSSEEKDALTGVRNSLKQMATYFSNLHITYLNRVHDVKFIEHLNNLAWTGTGIFKGMNGFDYMSRHLGYRFVLRNVKCMPVESNNSILRWDITIENVGFARSFFKNNCTMRAYDEYGSEVELDISEWIDLHQVQSGTSHTFVCLTPIIQGNVFLSFTKADTHQTVYFANENQIDNEMSSALFLGKIKLS